MKGSNRNKDHSAEGEGTGKRPKRKCLQWHPLLAKKLLDFSEEVLSLNFHSGTALNTCGTVNVFLGVCIT